MIQHKSEQFSLQLDFKTKRLLLCGSLFSSRPCPPPVNVDALSLTLDSLSAVPTFFLPLSELSHPPVYHTSPLDSFNFLSLCVSLRWVGPFPAQLLQPCPIYFLVFCLFRIQVSAPQHQSVGCSGADLSIPGTGPVRGDDPASFFSSLFCAEKSVC